MFEHLSIRPIINGVGYAIRDHAAEYASWQAAIDRIYKGIGDLPELRITRLASGMNGQIQETGPNLVSHSEDVIEADDLIVAPGLIDLHVHVFSGIGLYSIDPFAAGLRTGVTTMLDTGTAGALTYANMARFIIPSELTNRPCMIHHAASKIPVIKVLQALRPRDMYTHLYHPHPDVTS